MSNEPIGFISPISDHMILLPYGFYDDAIEAPDFYQDLRMKVTYSGSRTKDENISTYVKTTLEEFSFSREWTWERQDPVFDTTFTESAGEGGLTGFLQNGDRYIVDILAPATGKFLLASALTTIGGTPDGRYDFNRLVCHPTMASTSNSAEAVGTRTITYSGTGAPSDPPVANINDNPVPKAFQNIWEGYGVWGLVGLDEYDVTGWSDADFRDQRDVFYTDDIYALGSWDSSDVKERWEWELS